MSFNDMKRMSDKAANFFKSIGIKKGDAVMLALKGRYEWWYCMLGLHRIGAIAIPATHMLTIQGHRVQGQAGRHQDDDRGGRKVADRSRWTIAQKGLR